MRITRAMRDWFIFASALLHFVIGAAILWLAVIATRILEIHNRVLVLTDRQLFYLVGTIELSLSAFLLWTSKKGALKLALLAWFSSCVLTFRWESTSVSMTDWFSSLGNLTDRLPLHPRILDWFRLTFYGGSLLVACGLLAADWFASRKHTDEHANRLHPPQAQTAGNH